SNLRRPWAAAPVTTPSWHGAKLKIETTGASATTHKGMVVRTWDAGTDVDAFGDTPPTDATAPLVDVLVDQGWFEIRRAGSTKWEVKSTLNYLDQFGRKRTATMVNDKFFDAPGNTFNTTTKLCDDAGTDCELRDYLVVQDAAGDSHVVSLIEHPIVPASITDNV